MNKADKKLKRYMDATQAARRNEEMKALELECRERATRGMTAWARAKKAEPATMMEYGGMSSYTISEEVSTMSATEMRARMERAYYGEAVRSLLAGAGRPAGYTTGVGSSGYISSSSSDPYRMVTYTVERDRDMVKRYISWDDPAALPSHTHPDTMAIAAPSPAAMRFVQVKTLSDGAYPEVGMLVEHEGVTFEIERIEIETPSWRPIAIGHAVSDTGMFTAGRLYIRAPLDELQPAPAKEKAA